MDDPHITDEMGRILMNSYRQNEAMSARALATVAAPEWMAGPREAVLLRDLPKTARVIEIGPSFAPLVPKREGWNAFTIDHASREGLVAKYAGNPQVDVSQIEEVDFVWSGGSIVDAVPEDQHGTFDAFIASHVIEHTTDVVAFLQAAEKLLRPDGTVILAVPDKRKCFDAFRSLSNTGQAIEAYAEQRSRHTMGTHLNHWLSNATKDDAPGFALNDQRPFRYSYSPADTQQWMGYASADHYIDAHAWTWTPASFELMMLELAQLGFLGLRVEAVAEAEFTEFFAWLRKGSERLSLSDFQARRVALNYEVIRQLAAQAAQLPT